MKGYSPHFVCLASLALAACSGGDDVSFKPLASPSTLALQAARTLEAQYEGIRVFGSQNSGHILWIDAHVHPLTSPTPVDSAARALEVVKKWIARHPDVYRIGDPTRAVILESREPEFSAEGRTLRFEQVHQGIPIADKYGIAQFNARGELISLVTQLLPDAAFKSVASPASIQAGRLATQSYGGGGSTSPSRLAPRTWRPVSASGDAGYRLTHQIHEAEGLHVVRKVIDPDSGAVLETWDETPSDLAAAPADWIARGKPGRYAAHDARGTGVSITSTLVDGILALGFALPGVHALGQATTVADAGTARRRDLVPFAPIATRAADWTQEPQFERELRAATRLALHLETTQRWFADRLQRASWDGEGGGFHASIRGRHDPAAPGKFAAWGANGLLIVEDGTSPTGQFASDALDIVAHEFTHSVIGATAGLEYHDEPGALNESIADFFGKCVQGFGDPVIGREAGAYQRDVLHPAECAAPEGQPDCRQPGRYGQFLQMPLEQDHGGVHLNSGIVTLALSRAAVARGAEPVARLVLDTLRVGRISPASSLEEFAAALAARCLLSREDALCDELERQLVAGELLRRI